MKGSSNDNSKISDSGYTNTCVSQSQRSGSSLSRNSNRSESSGYCDRHPSTFDSSNYALPQPISKGKSKEHKKNKSKTTTSTSFGIVESKLGSQINSGKQNDVGTYDSNESSSDFTSNCKKEEEIAGVELVDDRGLGEHNGNSNSTEPEGGIGTIINPLEDTSSNINAGFGTIISMTSGLIVDTTPSLKTVLGYTRESWLGRSFIEFLHPKDKQTFVDHLAKNIALPFEDHDTGLRGHQSMFCSLRKNDEGKSMIESTSDESNFFTANQYHPFHLTTAIKFFCDRTSDEKPRMMFLTINADPVVPVYKVPEEMIISTIFSTHHDSRCILTYVDVNVVQYFGYMPQAMIGRCLFDFYHPEDLPFIKEVYETVVKMGGTPFRSKPYRFAAQNGDYVVLETEWSSFVNPWKKKLEFVTSHHRVLRGPTNPNVFQPPSDSQNSLLDNISEEVFKESKIIQGEIRALLDEKIQSTEGDEACEIMSRSKDLTTFIEKLLREVKPPVSVTKECFPMDDRSVLPEHVQSGKEVKSVANTRRNEKEIKTAVLQKSDFGPLMDNSDSFQNLVVNSSEHDSVILGAISPHHEYCDSKSSTETPPSYNQLNYNEKITRFFDSNLHVVTTTYASDEDNVHLSVPNNDDLGKTSSNLTRTKDTTLSTENLSSGSNNRTSYDSRDDSDHPRCANANATEDWKTLKLTESVLNKHNQEMEKMLMQQHKERRCTIKNNNKHNRDLRLKDTKEKSTEHGKKQAKNRGTKRHNSDNRESDQSKISKYNENTRTCTVAPLPPAAIEPTDFKDNKPTPKHNTEMWPALGVTIPSPLTHPHLCMAAPNNGTFFPVYYMPLPQMRNDLVPAIAPPVSLSQVSQSTQSPHSTYVSYTTAPLAGVIYPPMVCEPVPVTTVYKPFLIPGPVPHRETPQFISTNVHQENSSDSIKRADVQATSVKAEPGSIVALSECSKKLRSGEQFSSCVSIDGGCSSLVPDTKRETVTNSQFDSSQEDSSDSSFYGSFLTVSNGSTCNPKIIPHPPQQDLRKLPVILSTSSENKKKLTALRKEPPWQEGVQMTHELIYQYQITPKPLNEVLESDMKALKRLHQSQMVNDQLAQLYSDMELDTTNLGTKLILCEPDVSTDSESGNSGDYLRNILPELNNVRSDINYAMMSLVYEENAPLPPP